VKLRLEREDVGRCSLSKPRPLRDLVGEDEDFLGAGRGDGGRDDAESVRMCLGLVGDLSPFSWAGFLDFSGDFEKSLGSTIWTSRRCLWSAGTKIFPVS
jgi:hypothetical protein